MQTITVEIENCPRCGGEPLVINHGCDGFIGDSDLVRCNDCNLKGSTSVGEDHFMIHWEDEV